MTTEIRRRPASNSTGELKRDLHPLIARIYAARGVIDDSELDYSLSRLAPYHSLTHIDRASELLFEAVVNDRSILIVGDFDADGATSCAVGVLGLRLLGARQVDYLIPNRFEYGYGLTPEIVAVAVQSQPYLLVTVDNGISSVDGVRAAAAQGIRVLVTDHHLPGSELPAADAIVNPNQTGDVFPSKSIAGVGVMFYVLSALRAELRKHNWFSERQVDEPNLAQLLDLVALGTVADLVALDHNNRIMVAQGLARIRAGQCRPGISALLQIAGRRQKNIGASDLAFSVAPRLNAAGRLTDMTLGVECLLADDMKSATGMATQLDRLNRERRSIESDMHDQAVTALESVDLNDGEPLPVGLCLFDPSWHQGVVGIIASRLKARWHRPAIVFAPESDGMIKGSGRSVEGFHLRDALEAIASRYQGLIPRFGGHAMAAGLTILQNDFEAFSQAFDEEVRHYLSDDDLKGVIHSDGVLDLGEIQLEVAEALARAGPWGQGFPEPIFDGEFEVMHHQIIKDKHLKLTLKPPGVNHAVKAMRFNTDPSQWPPDARRARVAYRLEANEFRGEKSVCLVLEYLEPVG